MSNYRKIGVVIADDEEFKPFKDFALQNGGKEILIFSRPAFVMKIKGTEIFAVHSFVGKTNAAALTSKLISDGCEIILNYGLSGSISKSVIGQFSIPTKYIEHDFDLTGLGYKMCEKPWQNYVYKTDENLFKILKSVFPDAVCGPAVSGDHFIADRKIADSLSENFNAVTCDMETAAIASVCEMANIPFASLRRVSDGADDKVVKTYRNMNVNSGNILFDCFYEFLISII